MFRGTLYSINLLPFGAFVRIPEEADDSPSSFTNKPLWQRALIIFNGAFVFWLVGAVLFSIVFMVGSPTIVDDAETGFADLKVQISAISPNSPAQAAGLKVGDVVLMAQGLNLRPQNINQVKELQDFISDNKGREIVLTIKRGGQTFELSAVPRLSPPAGQAPLGVSLVRTGLKSYSWYLAGWRGIKATFEATAIIISAYGQSLARIFQGVPSGLELMGPVGIVGILSQGMEMGLSYFLQMIGFLSINVAILNLLPIPAFDGGKLMFLGLEAIRKKPVPRQVEERITTVFFALLIILMVFVTIKDVRNFRGLL
jgi:regulator of sigma E protease